MVDKSSSHTTLNLRRKLFNICLPEHGEGMITLRTTSPDTSGLYNNAPAY